VYLLSFSKIHLHQLAIHSAVDRDRVISLDIPEPFEIDRHVLLLDGRDRNRYGTLRGIATCSSSSSATLTGLSLPLRLSLGFAQ
jgi:hypothetical protein